MTRRRTAQIITCRAHQAIRKTRREAARREKRQAQEVTRLARLPAARAAAPQEGTPS